MIFARKAWRDLRVMGLRALLVVIVIGAGSGVAAGVSLALDNVRATRDAFYRDYGLADLDVRLTKAVPPGELTSHAADAGATDSEARLILDGSAQAEATGETAAEVVGMPPDTTLNQLAVLDGEPLSSSKPDGALVEADFAHEAKLKVGDELSLNLGGRPLTIRVRGVTRSPEYLLASADPSYLIPQPGSLAVVFLPRDGLQELVASGDVANDLAVDFPPGTPLDRQLQVADGLSVQRLTPRDEQFSTRFTDADVEAFSTFTPVLGAMFAVIGLLLIMLSLRRLVHAQRRELGSLLALGYSRRTVVLAVLAPAAVLGVAGAVLSIGVTVGVGALVAGVYSRAVGFPTVTHSLAVWPLVVAVGLALGATLLAALLPALQLTRLEPTEAMRGESPTSFHLPGWLERTTAAGGETATYAARSLIRRPVLTLATVVSVGAAIGLGAALNIVATSATRSVASTLDAQRWTHTVDLAAPLPESEATAIGRDSGADAVEPIVQGFAQLEVDSRQPESVRLVGVPARSRLQHLDITDGGPPGSGRIVVSEQTADGLGVGIGDELTLVTPSTSETVVVSGTARTLAGADSFLPADEAAAALGLEGEATDLLVVGNSETADRLRSDPAVARVVSKADAQQGMDDLMAELTELLDVLLIISLVVGTFFLISSLALTHLDRQGEFATLRALGYGRLPIALIVGGEVLLETAAAAALSVPLAILIAWPLVRRIGDAWFRIDLLPQVGNFVVILPALGLALAAAALAIRQVQQLDIATVVRARLID